MLKRRYMICTLLLVLFLFSTPSWGRELTVGGSLSLEYRVLTESSPYQGSFRHDLELDLGYFSGNTSMTVTLGVQDVDGGVEVREAFGEYYATATDWIVGLQIIPWGVMDGASPTDVINPSDYRDLLNPRAIAVPAVRARHYVGDWEIDGVIVPMFVSHRFPQDLPNHDLPDFRLVHGEVGVRISHWLSGMDIAASYYYGWDKNPLPQMNSDANTVSLVHQRYHMFGIGATKDFGAVVGRGEAAHFRPASGDSYLQYSLGFDRYLTNDLFFLGQWNGQWDGEEKANTIMASLQYEWTPYVQLALAAVYSLSERDIIVNPSIAWDAADGLEVAAGLHYIRGNGLFAELKAEQGVYVKASWAF